MSTEALAVAVHRYDTASAVRTENGTAIIAGFKGLDYAQFTAQQSGIVAHLVSAKLSDNNESAKRMLQRTLENLGVEKPKADGKSGKKQVGREIVKLETAKLISDAGITAESTAEDIFNKASKATGVVREALVEASILKSKTDKKAIAKAFTALKADTAKVVKASTDAKVIASIRKILGLK